MINLTYNGKEINQRESDGYVNDTQMCQANGKQAGDWLKTQDADRYINAISTVTNIPVSDLVKKVRPDVNEHIWEIFCNPCVARFLNQMV